MPVETFTLPNGLRVVNYIQPRARVLFCGLVFDTGSRDETTASLHGAAHFIEHMLFKGTTHRRPGHIMSRIDAVGGELNAYTTKEKTCIYTATTREHASRSLELLADLAFASTFPEKEMAKEKTVIAEEIDMYEDTPEEHAIDLFDELIFGTHPLAHPILGTKESIGAFTRDGLMQWYGSCYVPSRTVLTVAGNLSSTRLQALAAKYYGHVPAAAAGASARTAAPHHIRQERIVTKPIQQANIVMGGSAAAQHTPLHVPTLLLNNWLGGPPMNSVLNLRIRERYGLAYNLYSFYTPFADSGVWGIYAATDQENVPRMMRLLRRELLEICDSPPSGKKLAAIKKQLVGSLVLGSESMYAQMTTNGKDMLDYNRIIGLQEAIDLVQAVTTEQLQQVASTTIHPDGLSLLLFEPSARGGA